MSSVEEQTIEKTLDVIEDQLDKIAPAVVETVTVVKNNPALLVGAGVLGLAAGAAIGYFITRKYMTTKYESIIEEEVSKAKEFYSTLKKDGAYSSVTDTAILRGAITADEIEVPAEVQETIQNYTSPKEKKPKEKVQNIFSNDNTWDEDEEYKNRDYSRPYVISQEEFMENEPDHPQTTLTYFEKDDTLVDERDDVVDDTDGTIGDDNLLRFGHGSKDNNIVYIRNEIRDIDFEVVRSKGSFAKEVLGFDEEDVRPQRARRNRGDDE